MTSAGRTYMVAALCLLGAVTAKAQFSEATDWQIAALQAFETYFEDRFPGSSPQIGGTSNARCSFTHQGAEASARAFRYPTSLADTLARRYANPSPERSRDVNGQTALVSFNPPGGHGSASVKWLRQGFEVSLVANHPSQESQDLLRILLGWALELDNSMTAAKVELTATEALRLIMERYNAFSPGPSAGTIPSYLVGSPGIWNNVYSVGSDLHDEYVCGAWQARVLQMLDDMRNGTPIEKAIFEHYDYGPIQGYFGGHQAVVIYPKGTDYEQTGTVLDPWPTQRPETYDFAWWKKRFSIKLGPPGLAIHTGVGPSSVYEGLYPLTGSDSYPTPLLKVSADHMAILRRLPKSQRDEYLGMTNQTDRDAFIEALPPWGKQSVAVGVWSPVKMLITDREGRQVGWIDTTTFLYQIPGVDLDVFPEGDEDYGMIVLLPRAEYNVRITGQKDGTFDFTRAVPPSVSATPLAQKLGIPVQEGGQFSYALSPSSPDMPLSGPGGQISLEPFTVPGELPVIQRVQRGAGSLLLDWHPGATAEVAVEYSSDLESWENIGQGRDGQFEDRDRDRLGRSAGYYRLSQF